MRPFEYIEATSVEQAVSLLAGDPNGSRLIGGGSDLLGEMKEE